MSERNYRDDLKINPEQLDVEWINQPILFMEYSQLSADANKVLKKAEEKVKVVRSELVLEAKSKGEAVLGAGMKPTDAVVEAYYRNHPEYKAAKEAVGDASYEAEMMLNAVFAFNQRKVALENLVRLLGAQYFAGPTEPRDLPQAVKENHQERISAAGKEQQADTVRSTRRSRRTSTPE